MSSANDRHASSTVPDQAPFRPTVPELAPSPPATPDGAPPSPAAPDRVSSRPGAPPPGCPPDKPLARLARRLHSYLDPPERAPSNGGRLRAVDGLRLVAALMVVTYHFVASGAGSTQGAWETSTTKAFPAAHHLAQYGYLGVEIFFAVSGFAICMSGWGRTMRQFTASRISRLYPAYWLGVLVTTIVLTLSPTVIQPKSHQAVLFNLTMFERPLGVPEVSGVYWTLWSEMRFYLLFMVVLFFGATYLRVLLFCLAWTLLSIPAELSDSAVWDMVFEPSYSQPFIMGVCLYLIHRFGSRPETWAVFGFSWLVEAHELARRSSWTSDSLGWHVSWLGSVTVFTVLLTVLVLSVIGPLARLDIPWLSTAGAMTYPLYVLHDEIGYTAIRAFHHDVPRWPLLIALVAVLLAVSYAVARWVEKPVGRWLRRFLETARLPLPARARNPM
ncbi:acyltransferase [Streptomyces sp. NPDC046821]|uniref:acyltransferase family protein n=1 Tax=Streptomyces sp. NPDC046821 TaxID=3154702 RepID=UPI0033CADC23